MNLTLTPRLQAVARWVPQNCQFADIGTDHAYLPVWLLGEGIIHHAIASDLREGPLEHAKETAYRFGCTGRMSFVLSDGLNGVPAHGADCIAICGMGGEAIRGILTNAPWTKTDTILLLQPQSNIPELRLWLSANGYRICRETVVREDERWYTVMEVTGGEDETMWTYGCELAGSPAHWEPTPVRADYLRFLIQRTEKERSGLSRSSSPDPARLDKLTETIAQLQAMLEQEE